MIEQFCQFFTIAWLVFSDNHFILPKLRFFIIDSESIAYTRPDLTIHYTFLILLFFNRSYVLVWRVAAFRIFFSIRYIWRRSIWKFILLSYQYFIFFARTTKNPEKSEFFEKCRPDSNKSPAEKYTLRKQICPSSHIYFKTPHHFSIQINRRQTPCSNMVVSLLTKVKNTFQKIRHTITRELPDQPIFPVAHSVSYCRKSALWSQFPV